jgi:transcription initiation factor TFIID subunit 2
VSSNLRKKIIINKFFDFILFFRLVLEEVTRILNLEKHLPSYKYSVSVSCLKVIRKLQKCGHLPPSSKIYRSYAAYGQYIDVRLAAMECLVDFVKVDGRWEDLEHLLDLMENDPDPMARHSLARLLIENPPFEKGGKHRLDRENLVERIWQNMNSALSNDTRLRCDMVDLYYSLYGVKRPLCLPSNNSELASLYKPQKVAPVKESVSEVEKITVAKSEPEEDQIIIRSRPETPKIPEMDDYKNVQIIDQDIEETYKLDDELIVIESNITTGGSVKRNFDEMDDGTVLKIESEDYKVIKVSFLNPTFLKIKY